MYRRLKNGIDAVASMSIFKQGTHQYFGKDNKSRASQIFITLLCQTY